MKARSIVRGTAVGVLSGIAIYAVSAGDWLRAAALVALLVLASGCASPVPVTCPPLPMPFGTNRAARDAHALLVIDMYGTCAAKKQTGATP